MFLKGLYFLVQVKVASCSTMVFGYDTFNDKRQADNYQSGSNYRIAGTGTIIRGTEIFPRFLNSNTLLIYQPLPVSSLGTNFRVHSAFYNDNWRVNNNLTVNAGVRWDKNRGYDSLDVLTANDSALSPRKPAPLRSEGRRQVGDHGQLWKLPTGRSGQHDCGRQLQRRQHRELHVELHRAANQRRYGCPVASRHCPRRFKQ